MVTLSNPFKGTPILVNVVDSDNQPVGSFRANYQSSGFDPMRLDDVLVVRVGEGNELVEPAATIAARDDRIKGLEDEIRRLKAGKADLVTIIRNSGQSMLASADLFQDGDS